MDTIDLGIKVYYNKISMYLLDEYIQKYIILEFKS